MKIGTQWAFGQGKGVALSIHQQEILGLVTSPSFAKFVVKLPARDEASQDEAAWQDWRVNTDSSS